MIIEQMRTGAFFWSTKPPINTCFNFHGPAGAGKTFAQDFWTNVPGLMPTKKWCDGTEKAWFLNPVDYDPRIEHTIILFDDTAIGIVDPARPIPETVLSIWKDVAGTRLQTAKVPTRRTKGPKNADGSSVEEQRMLVVAGCIITSNEPIFVGESASELAVCSRIMYKKPPAYVHRVMTHIPSQADKDTAYANIMCEHSWMKVIGLVHSALGITLTSPIAAAIFNDTDILVKNASNGTINITGNGRFGERYRRFVDWYACMDYVARLMATGIGQSDAPDLTVAEMSAIVADSCFTLGTPVHCIQAVARVLSSMSTPITPPVAPNYALLSLMALQLSDLGFEDDFVTVPVTVVATPLSSYLASLDEPSFVLSVPTHFYIRGEWLRAAIADPQPGIPNSFDAATIALGPGAHSVQVVIMKVIAIARSAALSIAGLYALVAPHLFSDPQAVYGAARRSILLPAQFGTNLLAMHSVCEIRYDRKTDRPLPTVCFVIDQLCRIYNIRHPFFIETVEAMASGVRASSMPGLYRFTPTPYTPRNDVFVTVSAPGRSDASMNLTPAQWQLEIDAHPRGVGAVVHRMMYPFLGEHVPYALSPLNIINSGAQAEYAPLTARVYGADGGRVATTTFADFGAMP